MSKSKRDRHVVAVLADTNIQKELRKGNLIIEPFNHKQLNTSSYDITLGAQFMRQARITPAAGDTLDVKSLVSHLWREVSETKSNTIVLAAGETILAHSVEFIGGLSFIASKLTCIPAINLCGITISEQYYNIGTIDRLIFTITNTTTFTVKLKVGDPIAQVIFLYSDYCNEPLRIDINKVISGWKFPIKQLTPQLVEANTTVTTTVTTTGTTIGTNISKPKSLLQTLNEAANKIPSN